RQRLQRGHRRPLRGTCRRTAVPRPAALAAAQARLRSRAGLARRRQDPRPLDQDRRNRRRGAVMDTQIISEQEIAEALDTAITGNRVMLFMKGTPERPMCGFSMRVIQSLREVDADFAAMDILPDPRIRQVLSARSGWPTIPQLFVEGELVGGCDIVMELHESGELAKIVKPAAYR